MVQIKKENRVLPIIIVGLRRSGTTAFWESFRKDSRLCCYDEPFNPNLKELPQENTKGTRKELISLYGAQPEVFKKLFTPVYPFEETSPIINEDQKQYLGWLLSQSQQCETVVTDCVRLNFKLADLYRFFPDTVLVHLHRAPKAWISSHMFPSGRGTWRKPIANVYRKITFWYRRGFYNNWQYQEIIEREISNASYWNAADMNAADLRGTPAVVRLARFWQWAFNEVETKGRDLWGSRFLSISFEKFCSNPEAVMSEVYSVAGLEIPSVDYSHISPANQGFNPGSKKWDSVFKEVYPA